MTCYVMLNALTLLTADAEACKEISLRCLLRFFLQISMGFGLMHSDHGKIASLSACQHVNIVSGG